MTIFQKTIRTFPEIQEHNVSYTLINGCEIINNPYTHILEFGVASGNTLVQIVETLPKNKYEIFGFDSWLGLPENWIHGKELHHHKGLFSTNGIIPAQVKNLEDQNKVKIFKGWFDDTLPEYLKVAKNIALLHIDSDIYSSARTVLYGLKDYIKSGTIIVFDEWSYVFENSIKQDAEQKAFYEWVKDFNVKFTLHLVFGEQQRQLIEITYINS